MIANVFQYIDRIFGMVRPRRLLYMAIDGVAPRAKMNQQRSRRFRAAQEMSQRKAKENEIRDAWEKEGRPLPPIKGDRWDHNVITVLPPTKAGGNDLTCRAARHSVHGEAESGTDVLCQRPDHIGSRLG